MSTDHIPGLVEVLHTFPPLPPPLPLSPMHSQFFTCRVHFAYPSHQFFFSFFLDACTTLKTHYFFKCCSILQVPSVSKKTRELLQGRDFTAALDFANGEADGFMREFIHARPFANSTMFDWVIRKGKRIYGNVNEDPARILSDTSWQSLGYLNSDSIASLSDKPSMKRGLVFAETDDHNSGWAVPPDQNWSIKCCEWEKLKRNQRPKEYKGWCVIDQVPILINVYHAHLRCFLFRARLHIHVVYILKKISHFSLDLNFFFSPLSSYLLFPSPSFQ